MLRKMLFTGAALIFLPACASAAEQETTKKPEATRTTTAVKILEKLEASGEKNMILEADVTYTETSLLTGDTQTRTGQVLFQNPAKGEDRPHAAKFKISFKTLKLGEQEAAINKIDYLFDGHWLTIAKHKIKSITKIQVAAEDEKIDVFKIGKGPFPVPFGQKTEDILRLFEAGTRKARKDDPENTDYLLLLPRRGYKEEINFIQLEVWIDRNLYIPVRIRSKDKNKNMTIVLFENIKTPEKSEPGTFTMERPAGWDLTIERKK